MHRGRLDVLVIDDDPVTAELTSVALESLDARCEWVRDGRAALARLEGEPVDLVILEMRLPRVSGMEVLRALRRDLFWMSTAVIAVTSCDLEELVVAALHADADDVLAKPINIAELRARVARRLRSTAPRLSPALAG